jgi:hypothetical protein
MEYLLIEQRRCGSQKIKDKFLVLQKLNDEGKAESISVRDRVSVIEVMRSYATVWPPRINQVEVLRQQISLLERRFLLRFS